MTNKQAGFTLIELVMVIVILGILAVVAVPQFFDLSSQAQTAADKGVLGAIASGSVNNYAACQVTAGGGVQYGGAGKTCADVTQAQLAVLVPGLDIASTTGWKLSGTASFAPANDGKIVTCTATSPTGTAYATAQFMVTAKVCK